MKELHWETEHDTANRTMTQTLGGLLHYKKSELQKII